MGNATLSTTARTSGSYTELAQSYAEGVLGLMMPMSSQATHVSQRGVAVMSYASVTAQAKQLLRTSSALTQSAVERLSSGSPQDRIETQMQLLAKALTDLAVSQQLLDSAEDERSGITPQIAGASRTAALFEVDTYLKVLVNGFGARSRFSTSAERAAAPAMDVSSAKYGLNDALNDTLATVLDQTAVQGQAAFRGLVSIGLFNLAKAASVVGADIAKYLGYDEQVSELYGLVNEYVGRAHETILSLLGRELSSIAVDKALDFFNSLKDGSLLGELLEKLYETRKTRDEMVKLVQASDAELPNYNKAIEGLDTLSTQFKEIMDFVGKLIKGLKFVGMIPAATMPQAQLVMSASHAVLFTYIILAGADFADSQRIKMLNRVPGVRDLITANLLSQG